MNNAGKNHSGASSMPAPKRHDALSHTMRFTLTSLAVFAVIFVFDMVFHHTFMMPYYQQTSWVWRTSDEIQGLGPLWLLCELATAFIIVSIYSPERWHMAQGHMQSAFSRALRFGFKVGLLLGVIHMSYYTYLPITESIALGWLAGNIVLGLLIGLMLFVTERIKSAARADIAV